MPSSPTASAVPITPNCWKKACRRISPGTAICRATPRRPCRNAHLGLLPAAEIDGLNQRIDRMAELLATTAAAQLPPPVQFADVPPPDIPAWLAGKTIAVARDAAFCFLYPANIDCLERLGATLTYFSPLADSTLPPSDAVWLPGGYPELHGSVLRGEPCAVGRAGRARRSREANALPNAAA